MNNHTPKRGETQAPRVVRSSKCKYCTDYTSSGDTCYVCTDIIRQAEEAGVGSAARLAFLTARVNGKRGWDVRDAAWRVVYAVTRPVVR